MSTAGPVARMRRAALAYLVVISAAWPQSASAAISPLPRVVASGLPVVYPGGSAQPAGDIAVSAPFSSSPVAGPIPFPAGSVFHVAFRDANGTDCATAIETIGLSDLPTAQTPDAVALQVQPHPSGSCPTGILDGIDLTLPEASASFQITNLAYAVGATVPTGPITVVVSDPCAGPCTPPPCDTANPCADATDAAVPALPDLVAYTMTSRPVSNDLRTVHVAITVANVGDATSPTTNVLASAPGWGPAQHAVDPIAPRASQIVTITLTIPTPTPAGVVVITGTVDPANALRERPDQRRSTTTNLAFPPSPNIPTTTTASSTRTTVVTNKPPLVPPNSKRSSDAWIWLVLAGALVAAGAGAGAWRFGRPRRLPPGWAVENLKSADVAYEWNNADEP